MVCINYNIHGNPVLDDSDNLFFIRTGEKKSVKLGFRLKLILYELRLYIMNCTVGIRMPC